MRHVCPVCGSTQIKVIWETTDDNQNWWFTGEYACLKHCGIIRMSGSIHLGEAVIHAWHPECRRHGTEAVVISEQDNQHFYCVKCGRKMEVRDGRIIVTWQPQIKTPLPPAEAGRTVFWGVTNRKSLKGLMTTEMITKAVELLEA